jgi:hypothetical protein
MAKTQSDGPFHERVTAHNRPMRWEAVHLENRRLRVMVRPAHAHSSC